MGLSIRTNVSSLQAQNNLYMTQVKLDNTLGKLSSGLRINRAADDAAGLGVSVSLEAQISSYNQAVRNANDGISVAQTAEGALNETSNILSRLRELAMQSASDGVSDTQRAYIQGEATELAAEVDRIANSTEYNGVFLLNGTSGALDFQVGIRNGANAAIDDRITVTGVNVTATTLAVDTGSISFATKAGAQAAIATLDTAIDLVSNNRATLGAVSNRLNSAVSTIQAASQNLSAANSRIRDVDVAAETANMSRLQVLTQAGVAVLAQANQTPQAALKLLQ